MQKNYCTPIPAARISDKVSPELKIATANACAAEIYAVTAGGRTLLGKYDLKKGLESNRIYPDLGGITGKFEFEINFKDNDGNTEETIRIPYEVVKSDVPSTGMIDGCWITLYHWSEAEGTYFNEGLKNLDDDGWRQIIYSMHKAKITSVLIQNVFDAGNYAYQHNMTVDTYDGKAFYPSKLYKNRMPIKCEDPLEVILTAADECGMHVFPGVGMYAWFEFSPDSLEWHKRVTVELNERYGHHKSFYGWYISEEIMGSLYFDYPAVPNEKYRLMWLGRGMWQDFGFYQRFEQKYGAVFMWSMYLAMGADAYIRNHVEEDPLRALAARFIGMEDFLHMPPWNSEWFVQQAKQNDIDGVVYMIPENDMQAVEGSYFIKKRLEEAGFPVLAFHADPVNPRKWNAETMTNLVDEFIENRVIPNKEAKEAKK